MNEKLLFTDPLSGTSTYFSVDPSGKHLIRTLQDVTPVLDENKRHQTDGTEGWASSKREWRRAASIPVGVLEMWRVVHGIDWNKKEHLPAIAKMLDDPMWRSLRTATFRIGKVKL